MEQEKRRAAIAAYKERDVIPGIYAVRCTATGECWVGRGPDLSTIHNRLWFSLRLGSCPHRTLQQAWRENGAEAFTFERVEELDAEELAFAFDRVMGERHDHWCDQLSARRI
ncbi:GIY-YIG nuclease family protein [Altererythrobacter fulvus]|uniref:GIY-YIG nuclease family protein n=1 Tax=Caenibius fulvus TaxID=2126012 RepID=UPI003015BAEA